MEDKKNGVGKIEALCALGLTLAQSDLVRTALFGTYADGTIRSYTDARNGEVLSPKDRLKMEKKAAKRKKKNKKKAAKHGRTFDELMEILHN